jgi:hypothetical protein
LREVVPIAAQGAEGVGADQEISGAGSRPEPAVQGSICLRAVDEVVVYAAGCELKSELDAGE